MKQIFFKASLYSCFSIGLFLSVTTLSAQQIQAPINWFNLDYQADGVRGVSTEKAYNELLKGKKSKTVIVAVLDSGVEITHEDLKDNVWINPKEIPNNGIDDDANGYIDDINGWDFIGGKDGKDIHFDTMELTRQYALYNKKYENISDINQVPRNQKGEYNHFLDLKTKFNEKANEAKGYYEPYKQILASWTKAEQLLKDQAGINIINEKNLADFTPETTELKNAKRLIERYLTMGITLNNIKQGVESLGGQVNYGFNLNYDPRSTVGDNYANILEKNYGNSEVQGPNALHGTHVSGIIAANRGNGLGIKGICEDCKIMVVRCVPDGDERDKDIANAIRYAVDNGAEIINMSFGKSLSPNKKAIDDAVKLAEKRGVLLVHAAGNDNNDMDATPNFPNRRYGSNPKKQAKNWIEVGASSWKADSVLATNFSNFGKKNVDIFAPGDDILSTVPQSAYEKEDGTSMASPVVAGVAALIKSYYAKLSAVQLKNILLDSAIKLPNLSVKKPGNGEFVLFSELSNTAGVINAYQALLLAEELSKK